MLKLVVCFILGLSSSVFAATPSQFEEGKNCVSYTVSETVLYVYKRTVVGVNCDVQVDFIEYDGLYRFSLTIPLAGFHTGNSIRDRSVRKILGEEIAPNISMITDSKSLSDWKHILAQPAYQQTGYLAVAGQAITLPHFTSESNIAGNQYTTGFANFKFSDFGLTPPKVLGGFWVSVADDIRLDFRFYRTQTKGLEKLDDQRLQ